MTREDAKLVLKIYTKEKTLNRPLYPQDMVSDSTLSMSRCQKKFEDLYGKGFLNVIAERGANLYSVSMRGITQMEAYRDLKIEASKI